jgi:hypothetical protein
MINGGTMNKVQKISIFVLVVMLIGIFSGKSNTIKVSADAESPGTVVAWGRNDDGQATPPAGLSGVIAIAAGNTHSLALKSDGTVVAWGNNNWGQSTVPSGLSGVISIATGVFQNLALKSDGTVVGWGCNIYGEATPPVGLSGVIAITAGAWHSLALRGMDTYPPVASPIQSPVANGLGWNNSDLTITWNWADNAGGLGIDTANCIPSSVSSGEGTLEFSATCKDRAGNEGTAAYTVKVDKTAPSLNPAVSPDPVLLNGALTVTPGATDAISGVAS